jgi:hypothetical protein
MRRVLSTIAAIAVATSLGAVASGEVPTPGAAPSASASAAAGLPAAPPPKNRVLALGDEVRALRARVAILDMDLAGAKRILDGAEPGDVALAIERGRLAIYAGDYDGAVTLLTRADIAATTEGVELADIARGCARGMAATVEVRDDERGLVVRLQDDEDRALVPLLAETAVKVRATLQKDLGVELARPLRIDLVRDQFTLAAMTGLPEKAAATTGTVAVAKWGRVTMISPRAMGHGYPWLDTLAHEMTHLALSQGTRDRAPLWLQEGVAKREETRWREPQPLDDLPPVDTVALVGMEKGLGRSLDRLGPSIAMLPTAEEAAVAFAEVTSFIKFWTKENGDDALPQLVMRLKSITSGDGVDQAIKEVSGANLAGWDKRWRAHLAQTSRDLPPDLAPAAPVPHLAEIAKRVRLGELLGERGHHHAAAIQLQRAQSLIPNDATVRCWLANELVATGEKANAAMLVEKVEDVHNGFGRWWSMHGLLHPEPAASAERAFSLGIALDPLEPGVACEEKIVPDLPKDPLRAALCEAARRAPK